MIKDFMDEYRRYRSIGLKAIAQVSDEALNQVMGADNNSIAMIARHISGNLRSRFTDFLTSDGEKPWRDRDSEFADVTYDRHDAGVAARGRPWLPAESLDWPMISGLPRWPGRSVGGLPAAGT